MADSRQRHGCLTAWLILILAVNMLGGMLVALGGAALQSQPNVPEWVFLASLLMAALLGLNAVFAVAVLNWKKWGFWGFCIVSAISLVVGLSIGQNPVSALQGLIGLAILYGLLQLGSPQTAWEQLE